MDSYASRFWVAILVLLGSLLASTYLAMEYLRNSVQQNFYDALSNQVTRTHQALKLWHLKEEDALQEWMQALMSSIEQQQNMSMEQHLIEGLAATESLYLDQYLMLLSMDNQSLWQNRGSNVLHPSMAAKILPFLKKVHKNGQATSHPMLVKLDNQAPIPAILIGTHVYFNKNKQWILISIKTVRQTVIPILNRSRLGQTGEVYLFDHAGAWLAGTTRKDALIRAGLLLSDQRNILGLTLSNPGIDLTVSKNLNPTRMQLPLIDPVQAVTSSMIDSSVKSYQDYLGRKVVGAWFWDKQWQLGIIVQQNLLEAFSNLVWIQKFVWSALALISLIITGLTQVYLRGRTRFANANAELLAILHNTDFPIYLRDESDKIIDCNKRYEELHLDQSMDEDSYRRLKKIERQVLVTQLSINETLWVYINNQHRVLRVNLFPVVLANELPVKYYIGGVMTDVTEQELLVEQLSAYKNNLEKKVEERTQQIQENKAQMKALLDNAPYGIATIDEHGQVLYTNGHFISLFNLKVKEYACIYFYELTNQPTQEALNWLNSIETQTLKEIDVYFGSEKKTFELMFSPFYVSSTLYYSLVVRDISREKTLNELRSQSESVEQIKSLLIESLTKELKVPIQALRLSLDALIKKAPSGNALNRAEWSVRVISQALEDLKNDTTHQTKNVQLTKQTTFMYGLFMSMRSMLMIEVQDRPIQLQLIYHDQMPKSLVLDAVKVQRLFLKMCLGSLISLEHGQVKIEMLYKKDKQDHSLVLRTYSKGYGITIEQLKAIFTSDKNLDTALARRFEKYGFNRLWFNRALSDLNGILEIKPIDDRVFVKVTLPVEVEHNISVFPTFSIKDYAYRYCWLMIEDKGLNNFVLSELRKQGIDVFDSLAVMKADLNKQQQQCLASKGVLLIIDSIAWGRAETLKHIAEWHLDQLPQLMIGPAYFIENYKNNPGSSHLTAMLTTPLVNTELTLALLRKDKSEQLKAFLNLVPEQQAEAGSVPTEIAM